MSDVPQKVFYAANIVLSCPEKAVAKEKKGHSFAWFQP